tara:strand:- start:171 stop:389 length:219 start_codon:yes stop_codon:yes gene_type:complete
MTEMFRTPTALKLSKSQQHAVKKLYDRLEDNDDRESFLAFRRRVMHGIGGDYVGVPWCGMYVGIELDGHTHT